MVGRGGGGFVLLVRAGQGVEVVAHDGGVGFSHLQHLLLCINEHEVDVCTLVANRPHPCCRWPGWRGWTLTTHKPPMDLQMTQLCRAGLTSCILPESPIPT